MKIKHQIDITKHVYFCKYELRLLQENFDSKNICTKYQKIVINSENEKITHLLRNVEIVINISALGIYMLLFP